MLLTKDEAEKLLVWANDQNPGIWSDHSRIVARTAETIAEKCGLDTHRAYISGLIHDIGRYAGISQLRHVYAGYDLLKSKGYDKTAEICLSHSFPLKNIDEYFGVNDCSQKETEVITSFLANANYSNYDKLIQLCDSMCSAEGVCLIEVRIINVIRRYGFAWLTLEKIDATFELKAYFDKLCDMNIYDLFYDEIRDISFR